MAELEFPDSADPVELGITGATGNDTADAGVGLVSAAAEPSPTLEAWWYLWRTDYLILATTCSIRAKFLAKKIARGVVF